MRIVSATDIDLISPFPVSEISHLNSWLRSYKNIIESDLSPHTPEEIEAYWRQAIQVCTSYGVIDRDNVLGFRHEAPIIGIVAFEAHTPWNCYIHVASNRRAWGHKRTNDDGRKVWEPGFMDQAIETAVADIFTCNPSLQRVSAFVASTNNPARNLFKRVGFEFEGVMKHMVSVHKEAVDVVHYGKVKE